jgi:hypothetical protein
MQTIAIVRAFSFALAAIGFTACDKSPTGPAAPRGEPTIVGVKPSMGGPELLQVGETSHQRLRAEPTYRDRTRPPPSSRKRTPPKNRTSGRNGSHATR